VEVLKKSMKFLRSAPMRRSLAFFYMLFLLPILLPADALGQDQSSSSSSSASSKAGPAVASPFKYDAALSAFYQVTGESNGNFIREDTTESVGALASFRQPYRPWAGYEVNYGFTRFSESYNKGQIARVQDDVNEFTAAYLLQSPVVHDVQPFFAIGGGVMVFAPTPSGGGGRSPQLLPTFLYALGLNVPLLSDRLGVRVQYRALKYKTPSFNSTLLDSHTLRTTMEPSFGVYYRF
jgi:hypothetical protein